LIEHCGLHPPSSSQYALAVHSHVDFFASIAYPAVADLGLRVVKLGKSSVTYEVALFEQGTEEVKAVSEFVHVFVERETGKPAKEGMTPMMRSGLERLYNKPTTTNSKL
jgi:acyl-CoA thioester hydrolase